MKSSQFIHRRLLFLIACFPAIPAGILAQPASLPSPAALSGSNITQLTLDLESPGTPVSPDLYGLMTEEINHSYDGGLYAQLIQNRIFKDDEKAPVHWTLVQEGGASGSIALDKTQPINDALTVCLRIDATNAGKRIGVANEGFWGIPVNPATTYRVAFYAKGDPGATGPLTASIESTDGKTTYAAGQVPKITGAWKCYSVTLTTSANLNPTKDARFVISFADRKTLWLNLVSLFPPTYNDRPNGNRIDIMRLLGGMKPRFLRFPGGNFVEGNSFRGRFNWKKTLGPLDQRPGHDGCWTYRASDGMGLLEFLEWCEDLKMQPVLAVFAGFTLNKD